MATSSSMVVFLSALVALPGHVTPRRATSSAALAEEVGALAAVLRALSAQATQGGEVLPVNVVGEGQEEEEEEEGGAALASAAFNASVDLTVPLLKELQERIFFILGIFTTVACTCTVKSRISGGEGSGA